MELKKNFNNEEFRYSCPECRVNTKPKNKRSSKDSRKRSAYASRGKSGSKQDFYEENSNTNSINKNRDSNLHMTEGDHNYAGDSQMDDVNHRCSEIYNSDSEKRDSDMEADSNVHNGGYSKFDLHAFVYLSPFGSNIVKI